MAQVPVGREVPGTSFQLSDAVTYLGSGIADRFDVIVCFEELEHLQDLDRVLPLLRGTPSGAGLRLS